MGATAEMIEADVGEKDLSGGLSTEAEGKRCRHGMHPIPSWMIPRTYFFYIPWMGGNLTPIEVRFDVEYCVPRAHAIAVDLVRSGGGARSREKLVKSHSILHAIAFASVDLSTPRDQMQVNVLPPELDSTLASYDRLSESSTTLI
ncbi:hypothetical protein GW17_00010248 [Ensete ventricosum]|nr:hypothetical protein GW17_00010248 [Ensete ventricosum]